MDRVQRELSKTDEIIVNNEKKVTQLSQEANIESNKVIYHFIFFIPMLLINITP